MSKSIPIVQGYAVKSDQGPLVDHRTNIYDVKGEYQPHKFNDVWAAILFYAHLAAMIVLFSTCLNHANNNVAANIDVGNMLYFCCLTGIFSALIATASLGFMIKFSDSLVKIALFFQIGTTLTFSILSLFAGSTWMSVLFWLSVSSIHSISFPKND